MEFNKDRKHSDVLELVLMSESELKVAEKKMSKKIDDTEDDIVFVDADKA